MNVLLINPPREHEIIANNPSIIEQERGFNPPIGLLYLAACLEKSSRHQVQVIDSQVEGLSYAELKERIREIKPHVVGLTAMTLTLIDVLRCVQLVKAIDPKIKVVLGGPHVHLFPQETIQLEGVDFLVLGEGEEVFRELLDSIDDPAKLKTISGLVFRENAQVVNTGIRPFIEDLNRLPHPARHLVPFQKYSSLLARRNPVTTVFTSRGCPFQCAFCDRPHLGKRFRARSPENVVDELEKCTQMGISDFLLYDDTFTVDRKRVMAICQLIIEKKLDIFFDIRARVDTVNEEMLRMLKKAGCRGIHYGVEAGTEKILRVLNKGITPEKVKEVFRLTQKFKIPVLAYFMIGSPTETLEDIRQTFRVMKMLKPDFVHITIFTPFPGTRIYLEGLKSGDIPKDYWREFAKDPSENFISPHWDKIFSREELNILLREGYKSFYLQPSYMVKRLLKIPTLGELKRNLSAALKVSSMGK